MGDDAGAAKGDPYETLLAWFSARVLTSFKCKPEAAEALIRSEANAAVIAQFFNDEECQRVLVYAAPDLTATVSPPEKFKKKTLCFLKLNQCAVTPGNVNKEVIYGDFGDVPLEHLSVLAQEVFLPMLCNPRNQVGWPEVITKEVVENLHKFIANVYVTIGQTKGKTLLPLPPTEGSSGPGGSGGGDKGIRDKDKIHVLESAIVTWTRQIKGVLKMDPEAALKEGLNPGPLTELEFWEDKAANLNAIHDQLSGDKIRKVVKVLEVSKSSYYPAFHRLCKEVAAARVEANDNVLFLKPLDRYFQKLNLADEFPQMTELFKPIMHTVLLVWKHSHHYNSPGRIVVLVREICNDLIMQSQKFVVGEEIFAVEPPEAVEKLKTTLKVCGTFKSYYFDYKSKTQQETPENPWRFQNSALFARLDSFLERCHDILDLTQTVLQFNKLERVEIGGTKGKTLTTSVRQIYADFQTAVEKFKAVTYDIMDVETKQFDDDFYEFRCVIKELERRLGSVIIQAFDDCVTVGTAFKLLDSFEGLLEREIISTDLEKKQIELMRQYGMDLKEVQEIFTSQKADPVLSKNSPPHAGAVYWVRGLVERIKEPMEKLRGLNKLVMETEESKEISKLYTQLTAALEEYERDTIDKWVKESESTSDERLKQSLLAKEEGGDIDGLLRVNFDPMLVRLLREVKYFLLLDVEVPESAAKTYQRSETLRQQTGNLDLIVVTYNNILRSLLPVEKPLVEKKLEAIDAALQKGLTTLNWNSHKINDYIAEVMSSVKELNNILETVKGNVEKTKKRLAKWETNLMLNRKEGKTYEVEEFRDVQKLLQDKSNKEIAEGAAEITKLLSASNKILNVSRGLPAWKLYVEYVNEIVMEGFSKTILASVAYLNDQVDPEIITKNESVPLLEISLELVAPDIQWHPEIGQSSNHSGVRDQFNSWVGSFQSIGTLMKRLDIGEGNYMMELEEDYNILNAVSTIQEVVLKNEANCVAFKDSYNKYEYLWKNDLQTALLEFVEANGKDGDEPELALFDKEIARYKAVQEEIQALSTTSVIGWIKIDAKPIKQALSTWVTKWVFLYTQYLGTKVNHSMEELYEFMNKGSLCLEKDPTTEDAVEDSERQAMLYEVMALMRDVRKRQEKTDAMFEPLVATVALLKTYGISVQDSVLKRLEEAPLAWSALKKKMLNVREKLSLMQQLEARKIRDASDGFGAKVEDFRKMFQVTAPVTVAGTKIKVDDIVPAYEILDHFHHGGITDKFTFGSLTTMVTEGASLNEKQELFELFVSDYVALRRSSEDLEYLKALWDMVSSVIYSFDSWNSNLWDKIDVEFLMEETKKLAKEIKQLHKGCRAYDVFKILEDQVKALLTSLPLVSELHHPSMRDRHWKQLMRATGKHFVMDEKFNLGDLLALELHTCVDAVSEIVERAQKELVIEKQLKKIDETWASLNLSFTPFPDSEVLSLIVEDIIQETLENDNLALQNLSGSKYVQGNPKFLELVSGWQKKMGTVDSTLTVWGDVSKKWSMLESVFVGSADIRVQLPDDSKRFDMINADFQDLMKNAPEQLNVVEACNMEGRLERLENMLALLEQCEKALQDYLETKRIAFPRFYFVAPADLLDILSKGTNPQLILRHLSKCFDNVHNLSFTEDEKGAPTKSAISMWSGEKESVGFDVPCICDGPVETWLGSVVDTMRAALWAEFKGSLPKYDEVPRTTWMFGQSAQNTITVSRMIFTQEINEAFEQLEEGNDNAIKDMWQKQVDQLVGIIDSLCGKLSNLDRKKVLTLCTIDVHARDVCQKLLDERVDAGSAFQWQSQLRYSVHEKTGKLMIAVCDAEIEYMYEYIGSPGCLVITPLTDRCYITLTQAQRLVLGGAPAGPAGTGKTETVKDLGRALGIQVYVFNCSDQMDYRAMGQTYKGLAQTGAWGCFDEFNRIPVAVLSVCSTQYKTVLDAIRAKKQRFMFEDVEISLRPSTMAFITMNPGYPGRAELPESLKALFRPVSMCVPDLQLICENMLMGEGFLISKILARKFVILYKLCQDLLSAAPHYDWKLRAIKTTLYVAGGMKRDQPHLSEDKVLLQALRDFNLGKLTADDHGIFMGLLNDLFPKMLDSVPRRRDLEFEAEVSRSAVELGYQPEDMFILKIIQLREIFVVRWAVFLLGPAGCGKSAVWRTLLNAQNKYGEKGRAVPINPKAVTRNELYGNLHPSTREWKEGLMSVNFRDFANNKTYMHQWIVLDGDIDAEWIESMNTVMDDNKMLTLASNERIPLTPTMRLLLEINHMLHCSPATVSRGGVVYLNQDDIGWQPMVESWIQSREAVDYRPMLIELFDRYLEKSMEFCRRNFKTIVPLVPVNIAGSVTKILDGLIPSEQVRGAPPPDKKLLEYHFVFALCWALGGAMLVDKTVDYRTQFSKWWTSEWKTVLFPEKGLVFDYYVDDKCQMVTWDEKVESFGYNTADAFANIFVPSVESTRLSYFLNSFIANKHYCMFVGNAGTGKTALMRENLKQMDSEAWNFSTVNMNNFMDASALQVIIEQPLEKKSGVRFGPPGAKRLVYFFDDMNMPYVDKYDTQSPIELARQFVDYHGWYDKTKIVLKEVQNSQYTACMNPTAGSFNITPRMQRHFVTFAVQMPSKEVIRSMFAQIIEGHLRNFDPDVAKYGPRIADASIELHGLVANTFLPSAVKFHYQWNLRELSNITQGICRTASEFYNNPANLCRLWVHEVERVFSDRMVNANDITKFDEMRVTVTKKYFEDQDMEVIEARPISFNAFMQFDSNDKGAYTPCNTYEKLNKTLVEKLAEHNESNPVMDLVLFNQAMDHVTRITRIIDLPRGNAMLVGVGGSGKQSLAKLATFICQYEVFQISVTSSYGIVEFKADLLNLYIKAGVKGIPVTFLMTDGQIVNERFLVYINDLLSSGFIPDLMTPEDKDNMCNAVRNEVKQAGIIDTPDNLWDYFIDKVRKFLHVCLCFSPVGDKFRIRARNFPALINGTVIDWFQPWPHEALVSVAGRFLGDVPNLEPELLENLQFHCAFTHMAVNDASNAYLEEDRRYNYTTPKSYLELISLYKSMLGQKRLELKQAKERLENGVDKIAQASAQVSDLQVNLKQEQIIVEEKKSATDALIISIGQEKAVVDEAVDAGSADEEACQKIAEEVSAFQLECEQDLKAAEPIIAAAEAALNSLDKKALGELKSFGSPAAEVVQVASACMVLCAPGGKIPKDLSWNAAKKFMGSVDKFLNDLIAFDKDNTPENCVERCEKDYLSNPNFTADYIMSKSGAAAGLCGWVVNICKYFRIYQVVAPKRGLLLEANNKLANANKKLTGIRAKVKELQDRVALLEDGLMKATEDKNTAIASADKTQKKADLADRLVNGLSGENKRWGAAIELFGVAEAKLVGDVLVASSFVSYAGPFNAKFRDLLVSEKWLPDMIEREIPMTAGVMPLDVLTTPALKAQWGMEGLPTDPLSIQNGAIMTSAARWALMIDPQLQGIRWIKEKWGDKLRIIQLSKPNYIQDVEYCIENGIVLMIENLQDDIDAVLDPVVARQTTKRGRNTVMRLGDKEVEYDPNFKLYLQTKLSNPHYKPEIAAQTTLVNFCVTEKGLEDQLLALVVEKERFDLQEQSSALVRTLGEYTVQITELEDNLLFRLSNSQGDILEDIELIENLEQTKRTATEIAVKVTQATETQITINQTREIYRPVAARGALMYFLIDVLNVLDRVYQYSMANFVYILKKGMDVCPGGPDQSMVPEAEKTEAVLPVEKRVEALIESVTGTVFHYVASGLFERHKLIVASQLTIAVIKKQGKLPMQQFDWLLRGPRVTGVDNPLPEWVGNSNWECVQSLRDLEGYGNLPDDLVGSAKRWREWMELERPEEEPMPGDWKKMEDFEKLLLFRALRPDRMSNALGTFVKSVIGAKYVTSKPFNLEESFKDSSPGTPIFIFLSPGVDVAAAVEGMGAKLGFSTETGRYAAVSLGQGQEPIAMNNLKNFHKNGGWVLLQNIHLTIDWTNGPLEKTVDKLADGAHEEFRLFLSAEPPPSLERGLAISLLQNSIKLTNEPPEGMKQNLARAYGNFTEEMFEACAKQGEFKSIVFALCYFHAAILERKKFGVGNLPNAASGIGWNMNYPFNTGDLLCCGQCVNNYLENNSKVPWDDLKYIIGEIMYGGHVVEDWDRRTVAMYLDSYFKEELLEGIEFFPKFNSPPNTLNHRQTMEFITETFPTESPLAFGLHPNAEIGFKLREAELLCSSILSLQPRDGGGEEGNSVEDQAKMVLDDLVEKLPEQFDMEDIRGRTDEITPYIMVAIQEAERMNVLLAEMKRSLFELDLGLKGDLTMSALMETLMNAMAAGAVAGSWSKLAYPSLRGLGSWIANLLARVTQLVEWTADLALPKVVWLSGLFNPQSFLTAVMQTTARRNDWPLDKTVVLTEVTKKQVDQIEGPSRDGAYIHGLTLEGCRWDEKAGVLEESRPKEMFCMMPVITIRAVTVDKAEIKDAYQTPVYKTERRFREEVFTAQLKSKHGQIKWTLCGVCLFLDVV
eukprot:CAMPEP_0197579874 /NCGR_PEP_ID=MMETSP1326-20131121/3768_1 /TAXON_ID=1155430 /ORGANISM="Genus nov. species nov., Strain RCC2288" /LENGTH=4505 /DNA_ID=CAMNT_0043143449 /DNA_START=243 /DNA_END=13760 /DNA_ORIENTATION=+